MRVVFIGDIMGSAGRDALQTHITPVFQTLKPDVLIVNGENAAHGIGITPRIAEDIFKLGADVITLGNHAFDKRDIIPYMGDEPRIVRPANYPAGTAGHGLYVHTLKDGRKIAVINIMGRLFMDALDDPFATMDALLQNLPTKCVFVDVHAEATSEKQCMAAYVDGRVSAVVGTHTHVPTSDARILAGGTAYMTDAGMTGDYDSIIGMKRDAPLENFTKKVRTLKMEPAEGPGTLSGVVIDIDDATGKATAIEPLRLGPHLKETVLSDIAKKMM
ncbi:MAG: TIGR00282 family metallophosphoesterase [Proteobacteria bacterium]|nr:TIGR00282 family metallophosphoesterase [Pseudomonadota bacterium]